MLTKILLDIDGTKEDLEECLKRIKILRKILSGCKFEKATVYKTYHGWHIYLTILSPFCDYEIVAIQAMLGSDWKREAFNLNRIWGGCMRNWNILFQRKETMQGEVKSLEKFYCNITYKEGKK